MTMLEIPLRFKFIQKLDGMVKTYIAMSEMILGNSKNIICKKMPTRHDVGRIKMASKKSHLLFEYCF